MKKKGKHIRREVCETGANWIDLLYEETDTSVMAVIDWENKLVQIKDEDGRRIVIGTGQLRKISWEFKQLLDARRG